MSLRGAFVEGPRSLGGRARQRRWDEFRRTFPDLGGMSVLDLGGTSEFWSRVTPRPRALHIVNVASETTPGRDPSIRVDVADACDVPAHLLDERYDLVYSNSVIEHVGGHERRRQFADQVRRVSDQFWIQTPYRYFPVEPHWVAPGMHFLPLRARAEFARRWPLGFDRGANLADAVRNQMSIELLDISQMRSYFPDARFVYERFGPFVKSLIAVKSSASLAASDDLT